MRLVVTRWLCLRLSELRNINIEAKKIQSKDLPENLEDTEGLLQHYSLLYIQIIISTKLISRHNNDLLASDFSIDKTWKLVVWKYYQLIFHKDVKTYVWGYYVCLDSKTFRYKPCDDFQFLPISTHCCKNLSIDFVTGFLLSTN